MDQVEYVPAADEDPAQVARVLLSAAGDRAEEVRYAPRANTPHGVFVLPADIAAKYAKRPAGRKGGSE